MAPAGVRHRLTLWVTVSVEGGGHGQLYDDGTAAVPYATLHLRFCGSTAP